MRAFPALVQRADLGYRPEIDWQAPQPLDPEREAYLRRERAKNLADGKPHVQGLQLTRADVLWLIQENGGPIRYGDDYQGRLGLDLRGANLLDADCSYLPLADTRLEGATTVHTSFEGSDLRWARFDGAHMSEANFQGADLFKAHFEDTYLRGANLRGANLRSAWFSDGTFLDSAVFDGASLSGCHWKDVDLTRAAWREVRRIGDETEVARAKVSARADGYLDASDAYGRVSQLLRAQGRLSDASRFYYRGRIMQRKYLQYAVLGDLRRGRLFGAMGHLVRLGGALLLEGVTGYGELPMRVVLWAFALIAAFAALYVAVGSTPAHPFDFPSALVFSATSLFGRGYALVLPFGSLLEPVSVLSACEAAIGIVLELLFVTTFTRRLIGS